MHLWAQLPSKNTLVPCQYSLSRSPKAKAVVEKSKKPGVILDSSLLPTLFTSSQNLVNFMSCILTSVVPTEVQATVLFDLVWTHSTPVCPAARAVPHWPRFHQSVLFAHKMINSIVTCVRIPTILSLYSNDKDSKFLVWPVNADSSEYPAWPTWCLFILKIPAQVSPSQGRFRWLLWANLPIRGSHSTHAAWAAVVHLCVILSLMCGPLTRLYTLRKQRTFLISLTGLYPPTHPRQRDRCWMTEWWLNE